MLSEHPYHIKTSSTSCSLHLFPSFILIFHVHSSQHKSYLCLLFSKSHISLRPALSTTFFQLWNSSSTLELGHWGRYSRWEESGCGTFLFLVALLLEPAGLLPPYTKRHSPVWAVLSVQLISTDSETIPSPYSFRLRDASGFLLWLTLSPIGFPKSCSYHWPSVYLLWRQSYSNPSPISESGCLFTVELRILI